LREPAQLFDIAEIRRAIRHVNDVWFNPLATAKRQECGADHQV
jgi:hypothetical protein